MSIMEMLRMQQLDNDPTVKTWTRQVPTVKWAGGIYVPDLYVEYRDGRVVVEEVKPSSQLRYEENVQKWAAARELLGSNIGFRVVTEKDLGGEKAIREFNMGGLQGISPEEKVARKKRYYADYFQRVGKQRRRAARGNNRAA
jgi:hypothetical protein